VFAEFEVNVLPAVELVDTVELRQQACELEVQGDEVSGLDRSLD
jgi:hypothetical protein